MSIKLKLPRIITAKEAPLTLDQVREVAPAVFSTEGGVNTLSKYRAIPTIDAVAMLMTHGYQISFAAQARSEHRIFDQEAKHVIRMRKEEHFNIPARVGEEVPELVLVNAHDGSSKFFVFLGIWRFICTNGMMAGETIETYQLRHVGATLRDQMQQMLVDVSDVSMPKLIDQMQTMKQRQLTDQEQTTFAARAIGLRWPEGTDAITTQALLHARRGEDAANDMWHTLNRVQENVLQGGFFANGTARRVRPLEQAGSIVSVNRGLWDIAMRMAA